MKYQLRPDQQTMVSGVFQHWSAGKKRVLLQCPTGGGKCLVKGTMVLMFDGSTMPVENITIGDLIMGDDSTPRRVLSVCSGTEQCYDIIPRKGEKWGCNESHILSLVCNGNSGRFKKGQVYDISVREYLSLSQSDRHILKQYRASIDFKSENDLQIPPYFLGIWLGDGNTRQMIVSSPDEEIRQYLADTFGETGFFNSDKRQGKCPSWRILAKDHKWLFRAFSSLMLFGSKHIPLEYKTASREARMELLAGLIDTDGYLGNGGYEIIAKSDLLASDILFLARSLGFAAYRSKKQAQLKTWSEPRSYNRIYISGDVSEIPVKIARKKAAPRSQVKDVLRTGFTIEPRDIEQYYGFEIDGNRRFVLGDFTVTHNTVMFNHIINLAEKKGYRVLVIADRRELINQTWARLWDAHHIHAGIIMAGHALSFRLPVQIASIQTLNRRSFPPDIDLVIIDECRASVSPAYAPIFAHYPEARFLGVDATPIRTSGQGFDHLYDAIVLGPQISEMEARGALVPARAFVNPINDAVLSKIRMTAGDYNEQDLSQVMSAGSVVADLITSYRKYADGQRMLTFAVDIAHSKAIVRAYNEAGIQAAHFDGDFSTDERERLFQALKTRRIKVLSNVGIATYGVDLPWLDAVQLARPTKSLALYLQMVGRGSRTCKDEGKDHYKLLDHANCIMEHGRPNADRKWTLGPTKEKKSSPKKFVIREGGQIKIIKEKDLPGYAPGIALVELTDENMAFYENAKKFDTIHRTQQRSGRKPLWAYFEYAKKYPDHLGLQELEYIGKQLGFKPGWGYMKHKELTVQKQATGS